MSWHGLELRHLVALRAVTDEGSFKGAARRLGYTPSAVSQQIAGLERIVGAELVARAHGRGTVGATDAGRALLAHVNAIEARLGAAKADLDALTLDAADTLRVGACESVARRLLPAVLRRVRASFAVATIHVDDARDEQDRMRALERGLLDVAFGSSPLPDGPFQSAALLVDPWVLVAQAGTRDGEEGLSSPALAELPLVCPRSSPGLDDAIAALREGGVEPDVVVRAHHDTVVQELAAAGLGVALMPRLAVDLADERVQVTELGPPVPPRQLVVAWLAERAENEVLRAFVDHVLRAADAQGAAKRDGASRNTDEGIRHYEPTRSGRLR